MRRVIMKPRRRLVAAGAGVGAVYLLAAWITVASSARRQADVASSLQQRPPIWVRQQEAVKAKTRCGN